MLYFPSPADLIADGEGRAAILCPIIFSPGQGNLPASWLKPVASRVRAGKTPRWEWISKEFLQGYLVSAESSMEAPDQAELFDSEHRIGIAIDSRTRAAAEGKLYAAEHLRLRADVSLWTAASLGNSDAASNSVNAIDRLLGECLTLGGESRMCRILPGKENLLTQIPRSTDLRIKWVLATPAVFRGGWLPNWVSDDTGEVQLRAGDTERRPEEDRKAWRERVRALPRIRARLVAACIPKPQAFSGWDLALDTNSGDGSVQFGGPKPTMLAVPGGAVYYFEAEDMESSAALVAALHGRTQSDFFGEKGMGFGFCGRWEPLA
jgi:CRISPR-associated protein Cmr3